VNRKRVNVQWQMVWPIVAVFLAIASGAALLATSDTRPGWAWIVALGLAAVVFLAAWQQYRLAQQNLALKAELTQRDHDLRQQLARLTALHDMAQCLGGPLRLEEVLLQGAERIKTVLDMDVAHIHLLNEEGQTLKLETAVGAPVSFMTEESTIRMGECVCGQAASSMQPVIVMDVHNDVRATRVACQRHGYCTVASVPLRSRDHTVGILAVGSQACREFTPADLEILTTLGNQLGAAIENAQLYGEMEQRVHELSRRMEHQAIVQERERVSREIHDGLAQALALLNMRVNVATSLLATGQAEQARKELDEASQVIDAANRDVREAITALRLTSPKGAGFVPTLREFVTDLGLRNSISTDLVAPDGVRTVVLTPLAEVQLMRIIQEALTNVRKHAHAQRAWVTLARHGARLVVSIQDDGQGFDLDAVLRGQNRKNFGLTTMQERVGSIGGFLDVQTQIGGGTRISATVPCEPEPMPALDTPIEDGTD
jgi:two-component system, NarL family, nitrate/nitrite sensor histidine kinase NarX